MRILLTGSTGLIGSALTSDLTEHGYQVIPQIRGSHCHGQAWWDPVSGQIDLSPAEPVGAVIHLAGENIAQGRWTKVKKQRIVRSRVHNTGLLAQAIADLTPLPKVMISASAVGFYGHQADRIQNETMDIGVGFLASVCQAWEQATEPAKRAGIRVVHARFGAVLSREDGMLPKMLTPFRFGLGGILGNGRQYISWISMHDLLSAIQHILTHQDLSGPVNITAPHPVTNREFTRTIAKTLHRPAVSRIPGFVLRFILGELASELLLSSTRAIPKKLQESGFQFKYPDLTTTLEHLLAD